VVSDKTEKEEALRSAGLSLGIAFQIMDDTLDYVAEQATLGKSIGDDFREGKITLPVILAYAQGTEEEKQFWKRTMEEQAIEEGDLGRAMHIIAKYQGIRDSVLLAEGYCATARALIDPFPASPEKDALLETIDFCTQRAY
jgi:octaprenyl-diphosphate synthase